MAFIQKNLWLHWNKSGIHFQYWLLHKNKADIVRHKITFYNIGFIFFQCISIIKYLDCVLCFPWQKKKHCNWPSCMTTNCSCYTHSQQINWLPGRGCSRISMKPLVVFFSFFLVTTVTKIIQTRYQHPQQCWQKREKQCYFVWLGQNWKVKKKRQNGATYIWKMQRTCSVFSVRLSFIQSQSLYYLSNTPTILSQHAH